MPQLGIDSRRLDGEAAMETPGVALRVYCLGHFRIEKGGDPLNASARSQRKSFALLKTLMALGGQDVPDQQLIDALWPDSDGDAARLAFASALHRLRNIVGGDALPLRGRQLSLESRYAWCDCREFEALITRVSAAIQHGNPEDAASLMEQAVTLYRGPFLEGEFEPAEILPTRERLHGRFIRALLDTCAMLERSSRTADAIRLYQKGLESDAIAEELVQPLMHALARDGRGAEAEAAYQRLHRSLAAQGGIAPSAETESLHAELERAVPTSSPGARTGVSLPASDKPSLAVLPLTNMSGDPSLDYFSDGLAEDLITDLSQYNELIVVARNSSFRYKGQATDVREIGRELGVRYVLEGSVRESEEKDRVRITFQLADAATGAHFWAERYDRELKDVFALQEQIVDKVALAIDVKLIQGGQMIQRRQSTKNVQAYQLGRRGYDLWHEHNRFSLAECLRFNQEAVRIDPNYAHGWSNIGWVHWQRYAYGWTGDAAQELDLAEENRRRALALDPLHAIAFSLSAWLLLFRGEFDAAVAEARRGVEADPRNGQAWTALGTTLMRSGDCEGGLEATRRGIALIPQPVGTQFNNLGMASFILHRHEEAIAAWRKAVATFRNPLTPAFLAAACYEAGHLEEARAMLQEIRARDSSFDPLSAPLLTAFKSPDFPRRVTHALRSLGWK
jgi:TolB-like protein/two-component SAPR family response regulator